MTNTPDAPLCPANVVCPNTACDARGRIGVHSRAERRYICHGCGKTFAATTGTPLYALKTPIELVVIVLTLVAYGCPVPAIVAAYGLDERTVAAWLRKAGTHAQAIQEQVVCAGQVDLGQVQGDELYVKHQAGVVWMALAMSVFSRLWLWGAVGPSRDRRLLAHVARKVRAAAQRGLPIVWALDGWSAWVTAIRTVFRERRPTGRRGRVPWVLWDDLHIVQMVKQYAEGQLVGVQRRVAYGERSTADAVIHATQTTLGRFNTAYIERLNGTFRTWIRALTRRSRTPARTVAQIEAAMFWCGVVYNFCRVHRTLNGSPAMAAELTDHVWSIHELLRFVILQK
jgi:transposase-like protein